MPNIWFTADTHFGHCNILTYCQRPFRDHDHMTEAIIERFNAVLRPGDVLWHLGDITHSTLPFDKCLGRLNTKEIHLVRGNHDKEKQCRSWRFRSVQDLRVLHIDDRTVALSHYAMRVWPHSHRGGFQLYGHSHGKLPGVGRQMDVGVDTNEFRPYSWDEIKQRLDAVPVPVLEKRPKGEWI